MIAKFSCFFDKLLKKQGQLLHNEHIDLIILLHLSNQESLPRAARAAAVSDESELASFVLTVSPTKTLAELKEKLCEVLGLTGGENEENVTEGQVPQELHSRPRIRVMWTILSGPLGRYSWPSPWCKRYLRCCN